MVTAVPGNVRTMRAPSVTSAKPTDLARATNSQSYADQADLATRSITAAESTSRPPFINSASALRISALA